LKSVDHRYTPNMKAPWCLKKMAEQLTILAVLSMRDLLLDASKQLTPMYKINRPLFSTGLVKLAVWYPLKLHMSYDIHGVASGTMPERLCCRSDNPWVQFKKIYSADKLIYVIPNMFLLKLAVTVFTRLLFQTSWPNWLNFFGHFKQNSVYDWKNNPSLWAVRSLIRFAQHICLNYVQQSI